MDGRRANQGRMPCGAKSEARPARARARAAARLAKPGFPRDPQKARGSRRSCRLPDAQVPGHLAPERAASRPLRRLPGRLAISAICPQIGGSLRSSVRSRSLRRPPPPLPRTPPPLEMDTIRIRGAPPHNLKNIDLDLPRDRLIVITGLSGSGKASPAFAPLHAQRPPTP